jgi:Zn-dependent M28 family amino/carboxypeptidase
LGKSVPGAADNASGVAAVMKLAKHWRDERPANDVELVVLFSGCEESGLMGAAAWADRHRDELAAIPTNVINLDGLGFGPPRFLGAEVPAVGLPLRAPARLIDACSHIATEMGLHDAGPHALPGPTDGLAFLARRIPAITIVGFEDGERLPNYHTLSDTTQNVDFPAAQRGIDFAKALMWTLAREAPR